MLGRLHISLLAWSTLSSALVPADPTITAPARLPKRQNDANFIGWVSGESSWVSETCNAGLTWYQEATYAQCCATTLASCEAPTGCVGGTLLYPPTSGDSATRTWACTDAYSDSGFTLCNTVFIFENFEDSKPKTDIVCGKSLKNWSYYRQIPATATEVKASSTPPPAASTTDSNTQALQSTPSLPAPKKSSKVWIAGAVIGPLLGLVIAACIALFLIRRKKNGKQTQTVAAAVGSAPPSQETTESKPGFAQQGAYAAPIPGYNPHDVYNQQQQAYEHNPMTPAPQYAAPYTAPGSPPPQNAYPGSPPPQNTYASDVKYGYNPQESGQGRNQPASTQGFVAELGGGGERSGAPQAAEMGDTSAPAASSSNAVEMSSEAEPRTK